MAFLPGQIWGFFLATRYFYFYNQKPDFWVCIQDFTQDLNRFPRRKTRFLNCQGGVFYASRLLTRLGIHPHRIDPSNVNWTQIQTPQAHLLILKEVWKAQGAVYHPYWYYSIYSSRKTSALTSTMTPIPIRINAPITTTEISSVWLISTTTAFTHSCFVLGDWRKDICIKNHP